MRYLYGPTGGLQCLLSGSYGAENYLATLASELEIEADGGDDPVEFLRYAIEQTIKKETINLAERRLERLKDDF